MAPPSLLLLLASVLDLGLAAPIDDGSTHIRVVIDVTQSNPNAAIHAVPITPLEELPGISTPAERTDLELRHFSPTAQLPIMEEMSDELYNATDLDFLLFDSTWIGKPNVAPKMARLKQAFKDAMKFVQAAALEATSKPPNYPGLVKKYLGDVTPEEVVRVLWDMMGTNPDKGSDRLNVVKFRWDDDNPKTCMKILPEKRKMGGIAYDGDPANPSDELAKRIVLCPVSYNLPDLKEVSCRSNKITVGPVLDSLATLVLHELIHAHSWIEPMPLPNNPIPKKTGIDDMPVDAGEIFWRDVSAYGPYYARKLARDKPKEAKYNADSWVWFAIEVFWRQKCPSVTFEDPKKDERDERFYK